MRYFHVSKRWHKNPLWTIGSALPEMILRKGDGVTYRARSSKATKRAERRSGKISARQQRKLSKRVAQILNAASS